MSQITNALLAGVLSLSAASAGAGLPLLEPRALLQQELEHLVAMVEMASLVDLSNNAPPGRSVAPLGMTLNERLACEAIVCLSLITQPGPSCARSLQMYRSVELHRRVLYLSNCPQSKWFDLADVVNGSTQASRENQVKAKP